MKARKRMKPEEKLRKFKKLKEMLNEITIVVEGKKDKAALAIAGIGNGNSRNGNVIAISGRNLEDICTPLNGEKVAILTDFDETGRKIARRLYESLLSNNAYPNMECRKILRETLGLTTIEEINAKIAELEEKIEIRKRN